MMMPALKHALSTLALLIVLQTAFFLHPSHAALYKDELLADQELEERARALSKELRCLVCQNQSIDDSDAPLARDLRLLLRERLVAGDTDQEIREFMVARYGEFVLLKPPIVGATFLLWAGPFVLAVAGFVLVFAFIRRKNSLSSGTEKIVLSKDEEKLADKILKGDVP